MDNVENQSQQPAQPQQPAHTHPHPHPHKAEEKKPGLHTKIVEKIAEYRRVIEVARKPDKEEFMSDAKITAAGIAFIGVIGFILFLAYNLVFVV
jgi:protein transport protein SEC61 subunit gamma-like protein